MVLWISLAQLAFVYRTFTFFGYPSQWYSTSLALLLCDSSTPIYRSILVWALSFSLAATWEIDFSFSSSGYLDVSVPRVPSTTLCIHVVVTEVLSAGFPHSDIYGSLLVCSSP